MVQISRKVYNFACNKIQNIVFMSFIADRVKMDGLTFDDVLLIPAYSEVLPRCVSFHVVKKSNR